MNYGQIRDRTLQLIDQYSVAGQTVALSYNNQADYVTKIPGLINDALELISTTYRRIRATVSLSALSTVDFDGRTAYVMPDDYWQICNLVTFTEHGGLVRWGKYYHLLGENMFVLDGPKPDSLLVEYYRHPRLLDNQPEDTTELDCNIEVQMCVPYYVAAHLALLDNSYAYAALYNEFEARALQLAELPKAEFGVVEDSYSFGGDCLCP